MSVSVDMCFSASLALTLVVTIESLMNAPGCEVSESLDGSTKAGAAAIAVNASAVQTISIFMGSPRYARRCAHRSGRLGSKCESRQPTGSIPSRLRPNDQARLWLSIGNVPATIALFVSLETVLADALRRFELLAAIRHRAFVSMLRMEAVIHVSAEIVAAMKPRAGTNEDIAAEPFGPVISGRGTAIGRDIVIAIGTFRRDADVDGDLRLRFGRGGGEANRGNRRKCQKIELTHEFTF